MKVVAVALSPASPERLTRVVIGQPSATELAELARDGAKVVLDLRLPGEARGFDEATAVAAAGMSYRNLGIAGPTGLTPDNVREFARLVDDPANHPLVLHCATANRVGALAALKAAWHDGRGADAALALGREAGMRAIEPAVRALL